MTVLPVSGAPRTPNPLSASAVARLRTALAESPVPERFRLIEVIGEGGMGVVWRAHDSVLARDVAVKVLAAHLASDELIARLGREARVLAALEHPGIVPVFDSGTAEDGTPWYAMRLVQGVRLDTAARDGRDRRDLLRIVEQLCETVAYAHARGVVHRDLKPGNVMLGPFGETLILDWGVARDADADFGAGTVVGTPGFMAPEQAAGERGDASADIHGLGAILRDLVAVHEDPVPRRLRSIIARACEREPAARYASALDLRDDLRRYAANERVLAHRETVIERIGRFVSTHQTAILLVLAYLVMRVGILLWRGI
jgi:serine/threonine protein kinase